jgi:ATP-dependent protease HslVU (ClpYQ) ATPase subunit
MSTVLQDLLFDLPDVTERRLVFDARPAGERPLHVVEDEDLRKFVL